MARAKEEKESQREFRNRRAFHEYHVLEKVDAGIVLMGSEIKSIRDGKLNLSDSFARVERGEVWLHHCHISEYRSAASFGHEPLRRRKLLLHRSEIKKLERRIDEKGLTVVPLRVFFNERGFAKVELGVCRGKQEHDKRATLKARDAERDIRRELERH